MLIYILCTILSIYSLISSYYFVVLDSKERMYQLVCFCTVDSQNTEKLPDIRSASISNSDIPCFLSRQGPVDRSSRTQIQFFSAPLGPLASFGLYQSNKSHRLPILLLEIASFSFVQNQVSATKQSLIMNSISFVSYPNCCRLYILIF